MTEILPLISSLTDTHAHLCDASFSRDFASVLERAERSGVDSIIRNEPANLILAARAIAEIKEQSLDAVLERVKENTRLLYGDRAGNCDDIASRL